MIYIKFKNGLPVEISNSSPKGNLDPSWQSRSDWESFEQVQTIAAYVTAMTGDLHVPSDRGSGCWPRYDVVRAPKVGDEVSYTFNGDTYPDGTVIKVTKTLQVKTSTGKTYRRYKNSGTWKNNAWSLVGGHIFEQNPHF